MPGPREDIPARETMRPLRQMPAGVRRAVRCVLFDIDDTLTTHGRLTAEAYRAIEQLQQAGIITVPVTGRPAGWCDHIARMWPVDAVVGENGAFYFRYLRDQRRLVRRFMVPEEQRRLDRRRLDALAERILDHVPGSALASDQPYREADLAIDWCEDVSPLPGPEVERIQQLFEQAGAHAKLSSIHVNGWYGDYDKLSTSRITLAECFGLDLDAELDRIVFVGDSPNDAPMFHRFPHAVGVANVRAFADRMPALPGWVTEHECGAGVAELAAFLLD
jgi:HAD superfamily hydrolase (TIGR01484 family)